MLIRNASVLVHEGKVGVVEWDVLYYKADVLRFKIDSYFLAIPQNTNRNASCLT